MVLGLLGGEGLDGAEVGEELTAVDEFEDEIEVLAVLGKALEVDDEGVVDLAVHEVLVVDVVHLLRLDDVALVQQLKREVFPCLLVLGDLDLSEAALPKRPPDLVVLQLHLPDAFLLLLHIELFEL